jgi:hypothetical protein
MIAVTDHLVAAADSYINDNIAGDFDPLLLAGVENVYMLIMAWAMYIFLARREFFVHHEWISRAPMKPLALTGLVLGAQAAMWAMGSKDASASLSEGATVVVVPVVFAASFGMFEPFHGFHLTGGLYSCIGLLVMSFSHAPLRVKTQSDIFFVMNCILWALFLLCIADYFRKAKRLPIVGVTAVLLWIRFAVVLLAIVVLVGIGNIHTETLLCLLLGKGCSGWVPLALLGHSVVMLTRLCLYIVVAKYIGAPLCAITNVASNAARFYSHGTISTVDVGGAFVSLVGVAVFVHGQWMYEVSVNEEWDATLRSDRNVSLFSSEDDEDAAWGDQSPLIMRD